MKIVAVMPAYQEAGRVYQAVREVLTYVDSVVVVDDGSKDETAAEARRAGALVLRHAINRGQGAALKTGTQAALDLQADVIVHVDADGQHDPSFLPSLIEPIKRGEAEVVFGSRFLGVSAEGIPLARRVLLAGAKRFNMYVLGIPRQVTDPQNGLRAMLRAACQQISFSQDGMAHCSEILRQVTHSDVRWQEVPVKIRYTADSLRKGQKPSHALKIMWQLFLGSFQR